jgi:DNA-binding transcriptional regulator YhcF (GntR family)
MTYKLDLPYLAAMPYQVQICDSISETCKIYFSQIMPLAQKEGYMWATDDQLAEMKQVSKRTIERWNKELEEAGLIRRETQNVPCKQENGSFNWVKKRKIYFNEAFSLSVRTKEKKVEPKKTEASDSDKNGGIDTAKDGGTIETAKDGGTIETAKSGGIINTSLDSNINQQPEAPKAPVVVSFSSLKKLDIPESLRKKICNEYSEEEVNVAVERCLKWKSRSCDEAGIMTTLRAEGWIDNPTPEDKEESDKKFLKNLAYLDGKSISSTKIIVGNKYIEFSSGMKVVIYTAGEDSFKSKVNAYLEYLKQAEENKG